MGVGRLYFYSRLTACPPHVLGGDVTHRGAWLVSLSLTRTHTHTPQHFPLSNDT